MQLRLVGFVLLASVLPACGELGNSDIVAVDSLKGNMTNMNSELIEVSDTEVEFICKDFTARTPEGWKVTVTRKKSWANIAKNLLKVLAIAAAIAAVIVGSMYTAALFKTFLSVNTPVELFKTVIQGGQIASQQSIGMWYSQSAILAYSIKVIWLAGATGAAGGALAMTAASHFNLDFTAMSSNHRLTEDTEWLQKFEDVCERTYVDITLPDGSPLEGPWTNYGVNGDSYGLLGLETSSDKEARDALIKWCSFYGKNSLFGHGNTMPLPDMCQKVFNKLQPADYTCGATGQTTEMPEGEEWLEEGFSCAGLLEVSRDEMAFQDALMNVGVMGKMMDKSRAPSSCKTQADTNLGFKSSAERLLCQADAHEVPFCPGQTEEDFTTALAEVEEMKANAIYDCLALTSCNLLRKDSDKIQGIVRSRKTWGRKTQKHTDMLSVVIKRCVGHREILGPEAQTVCVEGKDCEEDLAEDTDMFMVHSDVLKEEHAEGTEWHEPESYNCDADDAAEYDEHAGHCACITGAHYVATEDKCRCTQPPEQTMKEAVLLTKNEAGEDEKKCVKRCEAGFLEIKGSHDSVCITPYIAKAVTVEYENLKQGSCAPEQLEVTTKAGKPFCLNEYFIDSILSI